MVNLVFIGGGHSNTIALNLWKQNRNKKVKITLISDVKYASYSGMLPAYLAGYYSWDATHINLEKLTAKKSAEFIIDSVINIDPDRKTISCKSGKLVKFDLLAIDIGSTPQKSEIQGANMYSIPAKPVNYLLTQWQNLVDNYSRNNQKELIINIIGGGAGGVELALNMEHKLSNICSQGNFIINLIHRGNQILSSHNNWVRDKLKDILEERGINLYLNEVVKIIKSDKIILSSGKEIKSNYTFLVTQSSAPLWLQNNPIATDKNGFILVKDTLQTLNYDYIFATGDIATMINYPRPKAGVFAVRQGKPLSENLQLFLSHKPLKSYSPPRNYLNIIGTGNRSAIASWGYIAWESPLLWHLKNYLDRRFMRKFDSKR